MRSKTAIFFQRFITVLLILLLVFILFLVYGNIDNRWYKLLYIRSDSMSPVFNAGDLICIVRPPEEIQVGDIVTFQIEGQIVTHRVIGINPDGSYETKGDASKSADDFGDYKITNIAGIYRFKITYLGYPIAYGSHWLRQGINSVFNMQLASNGSYAYFTNQDKVLMGISGEELEEEIFDDELEEEKVILEENKNENIEEPKENEEKEDEIEEELGYEEIGKEEEEEEEEEVVEVVEVDKEIAEESEEEL
jgi:signal peptidase I